MTCIALPLALHRYPSPDHAVDVPAGPVFWLGFISFRRLPGLVLERSLIAKVEQLSREALETSGLAVMAESHERPEDPPYSVGHATVLHRVSDSPMRLHRHQAVG